MTLPTPAHLDRDLTAIEQWVHVVRHRYRLYFDHTQELARSIAAPAVNDTTRIGRSSDISDPTPDAVHALTELESSNAYVPATIHAALQNLADSDEDMRKILGFRLAARETALATALADRQHGPAICIGLRGDDGCGNVAVNQRDENGTTIEGYCVSCFERGCRTCHTRPHAEHRTLCETCRKRQQRDAA